MLRLYETTQTRPLLNSSTVHASGFQPVGRDPHVGSPSIFIGVAIGRQTFLKIHAQLRIHNVRSCLCQKLCSVKIDYVYII